MNSAGSAHHPREGAWRTDHVSERVEALRLRDTERSVFGSAKHEHRLRPVVSMAEIIDFENRHQVSLPEEYRDFLLTVGNGGAGPCYGVLRLGSVDLSEGAADFPPGFLSTAFPHTRQWNPNSTYPSPTWMDEDEYFDDRWITGSLPICHFGCGAMYRLIVTGECRGGVWLDDRDSDGGIGPVRDGFRQWYLEWLENQEATLSAAGSAGL